MRFSNTWVRLAMLAALITLPIPAMAQIAAVLEPNGSAVIFSGLSYDERALLVAESSRVSVRVEGSSTSRSMAIDLINDGQRLIIEPKFPLRAGTDYIVNVKLNETNFKTAIVMPSPEVPPPTLIGFEPSQSVIPANTLRLYLQFSEPMAKGNLLDSVSLIGSNGVEVYSPFLNLETELWNISQTRATLLFDPGRIKQGVGPNNELGSPLKPGDNYRIVIRNSMKSAAGVHLAKDLSLSFKAGEPERRALSPEAWSIAAPNVETHTPLSVSFDRIMDTGAVRRLMTLHGPQGERIGGTISTDGGGWTLSPERSWKVGDYQLRISPALEDIAGNTIATGFDAIPGTIGRIEDAVAVNIKIKAN